MATAVRVRTLDPDSSEGPAWTARASRFLPRAPRGATRAAFGVTTLVVGTAAVARSPLVVAPSHLPDAASAIGGRLELSAAYIALAPICNIFDAFTLLSPAQHGAMLGWALALYVAWRLFRGPGMPGRGGVKRLAFAETLRALGAFGAVLTFYVVGALAPRPMAALVLDDLDDLAVDVHSHTDASHDGRPGFDAAANRQWHAAAGFDAVYVTDHRGYAGAEAGMAGNPERAGERVVLLPGIESRYGGQHVTVLGATAADSVDVRGRFDPARMSRLLAERDSATPPLITVLTTPARMDRIPPELSFAAVELSDGAPRGLACTREHGDVLRKLSRDRGATPVAGSNNHGWGTTATAWTVLRVPGWRAMSPRALDRAIRAAIARGDPSIRIVERTAAAHPRGGAILLATPGLLAWEMAAGMTTAERLVWLAWVWAGWAFARALSWWRRRAPVARAVALSVS